MYLADQKLLLRSLTHKTVCFPNIADESISILPNFKTFSHQQQNKCISNNIQIDSMLKNKWAYVLRGDDTYNVNVQPKNRKAKNKLKILKKEKNKERKNCKIGFFNNGHHCIKNALRSIRNRNR